MNFLAQRQEDERKQRTLRREVVTEWEQSAKRIMSKNEKMLMREARREALRRIENAARTEDDYYNVTIIWDRLNTLEDWRLEKRHTRYLSEWVNEPLAQSDTIIPTPFGLPWWRQLLAGDFIDTIFDYPDELWQLVHSKPVSQLLKKLTPNQQEIMYYLAIRQWTAQRLGIYRQQTDRNVRKVNQKMIENLQRDLFDYWYPLYLGFAPMSKRQVDFIEGYIDKHGTDKKRGDKPTDVKIETNKKLTSKKKVSGKG